MGQPIRLLLAVTTGAGLAAVGILLGSSTSPDPVDDTLATTTTLAEIDEPATPFVEDGETLLGNTALVPRSLALEDGEATLEYELVTLGNSVTAPETFAVATGGGKVVEEVVGNEQRTSVTFQLPDGATVQGITVTTTRIPATMQYFVRIPAGEAVTLTDGTTVAVGTVLEQSNGSIVRFEVEPEASPFGSQDGFFAGSFADGIGAGWEGTATFSGPGAFGAPQLLWTGGGPVPDPIELVVTTSAWVQQKTSIPIELETVR